MKTQTKIKMNLLEIRERHGIAAEKMRAIVRRAEVSKRSLTPTEIADFNAIKGECDTLRAQRTIAEMKEGIASQQAKEVGGNAENRNMFYKALKAAYNPGSVHHRAITTTSGASAIDTDQIAGEWLPFTHDKAVIPSLGVVVETENEPNKKWPKVTGKIAAQWPSEGSTLNEDSAMTIGAVDRTDYTLAFGPLKVTRQSLEDSGELIARMVNDTIAGAMEDELSRVIFHGSGSGQPAGLDVISGVNYLSVNAALQAATPPYGPFADGFKKIAFDKVNDSNISVAYSTEAAGQLMKLYDTTDQPLQLPAMMQNWNWIHSNSITNGGAYMGDFSKMRLWIRSVSLELKERYADSLHVGFIAYARVAVNVDYAGHFCRIDGITAGAPTT